MTTPEEFVQIWQRSGTLTEAADALGVGNQSASVRAMRYRKRGVKLKMFSRGRDSLDVEGLNRLIRKAG